MQRMFKLLLFVLRAAMVYGGSFILLVTLFSGSAASITVRDWTLFCVVLAESLLIGWLSARTLDHFRFPKGTHLQLQQAASGLRYGTSTGLLLAFVSGAALIRSMPEDRILSALSFVAWAMLTFGFAGLMWGGYLGSKLIHRGAVRLTLPAAPQNATNCNCSLCRRTGGLWAFYEFGTVAIQGHPENTEAYIWGDKTLRNLRCRTCGIITHREPLDLKPGARHGVNLRNFEPKLLQSVVVRRFDGADTWNFLV